VPRLPADHEQPPPAGQVVQVSTFEGEAAAEAWRRTAAVRNAYMAGTTARLLDMAGVGLGSRVLSLGAGTGGEAFDAAKRVGPGGHVVATDLSAAMIAMAKAEALQAGVTNLEFRVMDAQHLEFPDGSFDAVISRSVLMFVPDLKQALSEARRALRTNGRIGASVWSSGARNPRISGPIAATRAFGVEVPASATYRIALRLSTDSVLRATLRSAGFTGIDVQRVSLVADYISLEDAVEQAMELAGTRELIALMGLDGEERMRRWLERRWSRYEDASGAHVPGEQLVGAGAA